MNAVIFKQDHQRLVDIWNNLSTWLRGKFEQREKKIKLHIEMGRMGERGNIPNDDPNNPNNPNDDRQM